MFFCVSCRLVVVVSVSDRLERVISKVTSNLLMGTLVPTHSLTHYDKHERAA